MPFQSPGRPPKRIPRLISMRAFVVAGALGLASVGLTAVRDPASAARASSFARYAPLDQRGPTLDIAAATVRKYLVCSHPAAPRGLPILIVPGTGTIPSVDYGWNYERAFTAKRFAWCALTLPQSANGDIQKAGEYIVFAIRMMAAASGRKIDVFGWSQGGMVPRWALRFWPDTRALVADVVGLAPSNHGTVAVAGVCRIACLPALRQQGRMSRFIFALNSYAETFPGIAYTNIYTRHDDIVRPNLDTTGSSSLHTGGGVIANVAVQDVCPANTARHFAVGTYDPVAYALVIDALSHNGRGAAAARIPKAVCRRRYQPGVDPATFARDFAALNAYVGAHKRVGGFGREEPPLAPYVFASRHGR
jgi:hypothetical protein